MSLLKEIAPSLYYVAVTKLRGLSVKEVSNTFEIDFEAAQLMLNRLLLDLEPITDDLVDKITKTNTNLENTLTTLNIDPKQYVDRSSKADHFIHIGGILVVLSTVIVEALVLFHGYDSTRIPGEVVGRILGTFDSATMLYLTYVYGTSMGSARKTEIMGDRM